MGRTPRLGFHSVVSSLGVHFLNLISLRKTDIKYIYKIQIILSGVIITIITIILILLLVLLLSILL